MAERKAKVIIGGWPGSGKTTVAQELGLPVVATDDYIGLGWSEASAAIAHLLSNPGPWVVEGVAAGRAVRKWLRAHPDGSPCDLFLYLRRPHVDLSPRQAGMGKGCDTVFLEIMPKMNRRGVVVLDSPTDAGLGSL